MPKLLRRGDGFLAPNHRVKETGFSNPVTTTAVGGSRAVGDDCSPMTCWAQGLEEVAAVATAYGFSTLGAVAATARATILQAKHEKQTRAHQSRLQNKLQLEFLQLVSFCRRVSVKEAFLQNHFSLFFMGTSIFFLENYICFKFTFSRGLVILFFWGDKLLTGTIIYKMQIFLDFIGNFNTFQK